MAEDFEKALEQALSGLEEAKKRISEVVSWVFGHPNIWESIDAEYISDFAEEVKNYIDELKGMIKRLAYER